MIKEQGSTFSESESALILQGLSPIQMRRVLVTSIENPEIDRLGFVFKSNNGFCLDPEAEQAYFVFNNNTGMFVFTQGEEREEIEEPKSSFFNLTRSPTIRIALNVTGIRAFNERRVLESIFLSECNYIPLVGKIELDNVGAEPTVISISRRTVTLTVGKGTSSKDEEEARNWFRDMASHISYLGSVSFDPS